MNHHTHSEHELLVGLALTNLTLHQNLQPAPDLQASISLFPHLLLTPGPKPKGNMKTAVTLCLAMASAASAQGSRPPPPVGIIDCLRKDQCKDLTFNLDQYPSGVNINCSAEASCMDTHFVQTLTNAPVTMVCSGLQSCKASSLNFASSLVLSCTNEIACEDMCLTAKDASDLTCRGLSSCKASTLSIVETSFTRLCSGEDACEEMVIVPATNSSFCR